MTDPWAAERFFLAGFAAFCVVALLAVRAYALIERRPASWGGFLSILTVSLAMAATIAHAPPPPRWRRLVATGFSAGLVLAALFAMALL